MQSGMYGAINTDDTTSNGSYVIQFISEVYMQKKTINGQIISSGELVVKAYFFSPCKNILIGTGNNNHCNRLSYFQHAQ